MKEQVVIDHVEEWLQYRNRYYVNFHGTAYTANGTPDILTSDAAGVFLGIEAKAPKQTPRVNQWQRAIEMLLSNNRYIVAQDDFDLDLVDQMKVPKIEIEPDFERLFEYSDYKIDKTSEIVLI